MSKGLTVRYNAPVVLTFALLCTLIFFLDKYLLTWLINDHFVVSSHHFSWSDPLSYDCLFTYTLGHGSIAHLMGNMSLLLLIGPMMEEKYGDRNILIMIAITAFVTGIIHVFLFSGGLLGASGIVFMFIVLVSFADAKEGEIPLTFILIVILFVGREIMDSMKADNVSQYGHIMGGIMGAIFGFALGGKKREESKKSTPQSLDLDI